MKLIALLLLFSVNSLAKGVALKAPQTCLATREFVTTLEYLREHREFSLSETNAQALSHKISSGCTGASKRFIKVTNTLVKAGVPTQRSMEIATRFSDGSDEASTAFLMIFTGAYVENLLDLDVSQALTIALELSEAGSADAKLLEKNFNTLVEFCVAKKSLDLPLVQCAQLGARVMKNGAALGFPVARDFIEVYRFLTEDKKVNLTSGEALKVAEEVTKHGPEATKNFIAAFEYAVSKKGLDRNVKEAVEFGTTMALRSVRPST